MKIKLLLLSDINSAHTQKWAVALSKKKVQIAVFSMSQPIADWFSVHGIVLANSSSISKNKLKAASLSKITYLKLVPQLKSAISRYKPDLIHAHYATSYGLLGALSGFHPFIISAWGSDVMDFPNKNILNKSILKYNFRKSDCILASSDAVVNAISLLTTKKITKIPFGIDTDYFKKMNVPDRIFLEHCIVIGAVKSLEEIYGIDILIKAFKNVCENENKKVLKLLIVGGGSKENQYKTLVKELNIEDHVHFTGKVEYSEVLKYHNWIDIFVNVSRNESFGVSVLEASACEKPVIVSNVGGLPEVIIDNETGLLVEPENSPATAAAIRKLVMDDMLRKQMGKNGRAFVQKKYSFENNVNDTLAIYKQLITNS